MSTLWHCLTMLVVLSGLPGSGKTTVGRVVAEMLTAAYIRIDALEAAMWRAGIEREQPTGLAAYVVAEAIAEGSLAAGSSVVVDAVNAVEAARKTWRDLAARAHKPLRIIEVVCSDEDEHRRRVESRSVDLEGHYVPSWPDVVSREYEPWQDARLVVDTTRPVADCAVQIEEYLST
jgi:predicted kinase